MPAVHKWFGRRISNSTMAAEARTTFMNFATILLEQSFMLTKHSAQTRDNGSALALCSNCSVDYLEPIMDLLCCAYPIANYFSRAKLRCILEFRCYLLTTYIYIRYLTKYTRIFCLE